MGDYVVISEETSDIRVVSTVTFNQLFVSGQMKCTASNGIGSSASKLVDVVVMGPGSPPGEIDIKIINDAIQLNWEAPPIPNGIITACII